MYVVSGWQPRRAHTDQTVAMPMNEGQGARMRVASILVSPLSCPLLTATWTVVRSRRCTRGNAMMAVAVGTLSLRNRLRRVHWSEKVVNRYGTEEPIMLCFGP